MKFRLKSPFKPTGDQPGSIEKIVKNFKAGAKNQTLLGVTGSGKTFVMAEVIAKLNRPTLVLSHNKTLAAQLYQEFKEFFPENAVHYFVSYYDYYQPEAYTPQTDTYIEKDAKINETIDRLRHEATQSLLSRKDVIVVASVSAIYNIGSPEDYANIALDLTHGQKIKQGECLERLIDLQYSRNDFDPQPGNFRARGETVEIFNAAGNQITRISWLGSKIQNISISENNLQKRFENVSTVKIWPAKHYVSPKEKLSLALDNIKSELALRTAEFKKQGKLLEVERLKQRTLFDLEMLRQVGYCPGIENYSRHLSFSKPGEPPFNLLDYFQTADKNFLTFIDESHITIPQFRGMYNGDRARKEVLVNYGFRLLSALDNRPLKFEEFENKIRQALFVSATPSRYEIGKSGPYITEQLIRPTGLLDPKIEIRPVKNQIKDLIEATKNVISRGGRVLVTTLTKRLAEDITEYLLGQNLKVAYLHSEIKTLNRTEILKDLREGKVDILVGINLLREGLDLPEVQLVAILDADKEGFLRNEASIIQTIGRAARHPQGRAILYADQKTVSIKNALAKTERRRKIQEAYNKDNNITPQAIEKAIRANLLVEAQKKSRELNIEFASFSGHERIKELESEMKKSARNLEFERAAQIRDYLQSLSGSRNST